MLFSSPLTAETPGTLPMVSISDAILPTNSEAPGNMLVIGLINCLMNPISATTSGPSSATSMKDLSVMIPPLAKDPSVSGLSPGPSGIPIISARRSANHSPPNCVTPIRTGAKKAPIPPEKNAALPVRAVPNARPAIEPPSRIATRTGGTPSFN